MSEDPKTYNPELGQLLYGQPFQRHACESYIEAALGMIRAELGRVMWNLHQRDYENPFDNSGAEFDCDVFSAHAYSWGEDDQPWNFRWKDWRCSWYKWYGRGTTQNYRLSPDDCAKMLDECLDAVRALEIEVTP